MALHARDFLKVTVLATSDTTGPGKPSTTEYIMGLINVDKSDPIFFSVVYKPPDVHFTKNNTDTPDVTSINKTPFIDHLKLHSGEYTSKIIMGDFNANLLLTSSDATYLRDVTSELALKVVEHGPTHFSTTPGTWIDAIFVGCIDKIICTENRPAPYHNHHNIIGVTIDRLTLKPPCESFTYRAFNKINVSDLNRILHGCNWSTFNSDAPDLTDMVTQLTNNLTDTIDTLAPRRTFIPKKRQPPWIDSELQLLHRKRDSAMRRYKRTGDRSFLDEFLRLRRDITNDTTRKRTHYINDSLKKTIDNNGNIWTKLRSLGLLPKSAEGLHGFSLSELNNHFASVSCSPTETIDQVTEIINSAPVEGFSFHHVSLSDVILAVAHFTSQAKGEDEIPQGVVAKALPTISPLLVNLFNSSLDKDTFPGAWKKAQLIPLKKNQLLHLHRIFGRLPYFAFSPRSWKN